MRSNSTTKPRTTAVRGQLDSKKKMAEATRVLRQQRAKRVADAPTKASKETGLFRSEWLRPIGRSSSAFWKTLMP